MKYRVIARDEDLDGFLKPLLDIHTPDFVVSHELAYRSLKARLEERLSLKRQLEAELADGPSRARRAEIGNKLLGINGDLGDLRVLVRDAGELSYATVYQRVAERMLSKETKILIDEHVRFLMGRPKIQVKQNNPVRLAHSARVKGLVTA